MPAISNTPKHSNTLTTLMKRFSIILLLLAAVILPLRSQICYKVEGNGLKHPSYLFGTHHLAPMSVYSGIEGAKKGFADAAVVVGETDMEALSDMTVAMQMQELALAPADSTLTRLIPAEKMEQYTKTFAGLVPNAPLAMFDAFKPLVPINVATLTLISQNLEGFNPEEQLDTWFQLQGKLEGKKIVTLETPIEQARMLYCGLPVSAQAKALCKLLDDPDKIVEQAKTLNKAYLDADLEELLKLSEEEDDPESAAFNEIILLNRNKAWLEKLPAILEEAPTFVAVGALHLAGPQGLVEGLRKKGYTVTAVK